MSEKVKSLHVGRKALLYVRQSSSYQVLTIWKARNCNTPWSSA